MLEINYQSFPKPFPQTLLSMILQKENLWKSLKLVTRYHYADYMAWDCNLISGVACICITELAWLLFFIISSLFQKGRILSAALFSFTLIDNEFNYVFLAHRTWEIGNCLLKIKNILEKLMIGLLNQWTGSDGISLAIKQSQSAPGYMKFLSMCMYYMNQENMLIAILHVKGTCFVRVANFGPFNHSDITNKIKTHVQHPQRWQPNNHIQQKTEVWALQRWGIPWSQWDQPGMKHST